MRTFQNPLKRSKYFFQLELFLKVSWYFKTECPGSQVSPSFEGTFIARLSSFRNHYSRSACKMASVMKEIAKRASNLIVKGKTPEAWDTTAELRNKYLYTTLDAMPARVAEASKEWANLRNKVTARDFTVNEVGVGAVRAVELYAFYLIGKMVGSRSMPN